MQDRARELGFQEVVVIDEDLGVSRAGHHERPGFGRSFSAEKLDMLPGHDRAVCDGLE